MNPDYLEPSEGSFCNPDAIELSVYPELASTSAYMVLSEKGLTDAAREMLGVMGKADDLVLSEAFRSIEHAAELHPETLGIPADVPQGSRLTWLGLHLQQFEGRSDLDALRAAVQMCREINATLEMHRTRGLAN